MPGRALTLKRRQAGFAAASGLPRLGGVTASIALQGSSGSISTPARNRRGVAGCAVGAGVAFCCGRVIPVGGDGGS